MSHGRFPAWIVVLAAAAALSACGGGARGDFQVDTSPLRILLTSVDPGQPGVHVNDVGDESGEQIVLVRDGAGQVLADRRIEIPIAGGHGGPYVISVIQGALPFGVAVEDGIDPDTGAFRHHLSGILREAGSFAFRLQVVDKGSVPFLSTTQDVGWDVAVGEVRIVDADPPLAPRGTLDKDGDGIVDNPDYDALKSVIYNQFTSIDLIVAGGTPPYVCQVVDDPSNPDDGLLPLGFSIPPDSTAIVGAASEVRPGGFVITFEATDALGRKGRRTVQWAIDTPAIIIATPTLPDGKCGSPFSETVQIVDGVPPFRFELVREDVARDGDGEPTVVYQSPNPPIISPAGAVQKIGVADYPAPAAPGPDYTSYRTPPEGVFLGDVENDPLAGLGSFTGVPRRRGTFHVIVHVSSALLPNEHGQQAWQAYTFDCEDSEPPIGSSPAFGHNAAYTIEKAFSPAPPYTRIPDAEVSLNYNPDATTHPALGLQLLARGGVPKDGLTDGPHSSQVTSIEGLGVGQESPGTFSWQANWNPPGDGDGYSSQPGGIEFLAHLGLLRVDPAVGPNNLTRQGLQAVAFTVTDQQLPVAHARSQTVNFSIGPDRVIVTESTSSDTTTSYGYWTMNDAALRIRMCEPFATAPSVRDLIPADLSKTTTIPAATGLGATAVGQLLSALNDAGTAVDGNRRMDLLRVTVNPAGWWNDVHQLCAAGARPMQHADVNKGYNNYGNGYYSIGNGSASWVPNVTCVELPDCTSPAVTASVDAGVYKDGGQLYVFQSASYFGVFVVRRDGTIFVPCAFDKTTYRGFGDAWTNGYAASQSTYLRMPSLTVSPDGRFAALKLKVTETSIFDGAPSTPIVIFSLTGEQPFGGASYQVIGTGSSGGSTSGGVYLYAPTLTLTNRHLYYVCGNNSTGYQAAWQGHFLYRYEIADASGAVTASAGAGSILPPAVADAEWTLTSSVPMQTPFHKWESPGTSTLNADQYGYDGANFIENSAAPVPFRVSRNGKAIAILAGSDPGSVTSGVGVMSHHVWVDHDGAGVRRLSSVKRRHPGGASRGYQLSYGPNSYPHWGRYTGPTTQMEISDDASKVAVVCNRYPTTSSVTVTTSTPVWYAYREDLVAFKSANAWVNTTEIQVTGDDAGSNRIFGSNAYWRFGALVFTRDNAGIVFWGGCSSYYASSATYYYQDSVQQTGTLYSCNLNSATGGTSGVAVYAILPTNDGGSSAGVTSTAYTTSNQYNPSLAAGSYSATAGVLKPVGGFMSGNGNFFYLMNSGALNSSDYTNYRLVGCNVRSLNTAQNVNGNLDGRAFAVSNWPSQHGFVPTYYGYYPYYECFYYKYAYGGFQQGGGLQVMARKGGSVFFADFWQSSYTQYLSSYSYGGPLYNTGAFDYGFYNGQVHCFNADIGGPVQKVTTYTGDTATYNYRTLQYVYPSVDGSKCVVIRNAYQSNIVMRDQENLDLVTDARLGPTGTLVPASQLVLQLGGQGRVSTSVAFSSNGDKIYYAIGSGNENNKTLYEQGVVPENGALPTARTVSATARWYEILHVGR